MVQLVQWQMRWKTRRSARVPEALVRMLTAEEMPTAGWRVMDERTWRTGIAPLSDTARRAREVGSITAWRSYEDSAGASWVWLQVVPMASPADAREALLGLKDKMLANPRAKGEVVSEQDVELAPFPGAQTVWAHEYHTTGRAGDGVARILAGAVGQDILVVSVSGSPEWDWAATSELAARQAKNLVPQEA
jgi:hypothetical protein